MALRPIDPFLSIQNFHESMLTIMLQSLSSLSPGSKKLPVVKLVDNFDASYGCVANEGPVFTFITNLDAPRYRYEGSLRQEHLSPDEGKDKESSLWLSFIQPAPHLTDSL